MPELPEVETIRRDLEAALLGQTVVAFEVFDSRLISPKEVARWSKLIVGQVWKSFHRKGKYLEVELANDWRLVVHLRMTGQLLLSPSSGLRPPSPALPREKAKPCPLPAEDGRGWRSPGEGSRLRLCFANGKILRLVDQRRFAEIWLLRPGEAWRSRNPLGPDALTELKRDEFVRLVKNRTTRIQPLLMDQRFLSGVGNIYAQEALFKAAIRPTRHGSRITAEEASRLYVALRETLTKAIAYRGSSSRNYRDANGEEGSAQTLHAVYRKGGKPCPQCRGRLRATRVGGRGSVFCPQCQK